MSLKNIITISMIFNFLLAVHIPVRLSGQSHCDGQSLEQASKDYLNGNFQKVLSLRDCLNKSFSIQQEIEANRLLCLTYLAIDSLQLSAYHASQILKLRPDYEAGIYDTPRFRDMIASLRQEGKTQEVTSVSKKAENLYEAPANIMLISREDIVKRAYTSLVDLLMDIPGFDITLFYGSEYANIYQRGFRQNNTEKTLLLIDGIEDNDLWTNWAYVSRQYPLSAIERVEIIYGPASTMYGPNAFAGVINVITRKAESLCPDGRTAGASFNTGYGSYNSWWADISLAAKKEKFSVQMNARVFQSDEMNLSSQEFFDYSPEAYNITDYASLLAVNKNAGDYLENEGLPQEHPYYIYDEANDRISITEQGQEAARKLDKSAYDQTVNGNPIAFTNKTKSWYVNAKLKFGKFTLGVQSWKQSQGSTTQYTDTYVAGSENGFVWVPHLSCIYSRYDDQISEKLFFSNATNYRIHNLTDDSKFVSLSNYARGNLALADLVNDKAPYWTTLHAYESSKQLRSESKLIWTPIKRFNLVSGLEVRNSSLQGGYLFSIYEHPQDSAMVSPVPGGNTFNVWDVGLYSQATYHLLEKLHLIMGARYDYNKIRTEGGFGSEISPRFVVVYMPGKFIFKAIYSRGIQNVSNWTKFSTAGNRLPNPGLGTEVIRNYELTASYMPAKKFFADASLYFSSIDDVVGTKTLDAATGLNQNVNIGKFEIYGIQANLQYNSGTFSAWLNYTFTHPRQTYDESGEVDNRVGDIASHQINGGMDKGLLDDKLNINLRFNYCGERETGYGTTVPDNYESFPATFIINTALTYKLPVEGLRLQLACNNLMDNKYYHPGTKAADGSLNPTRILQRDRNFLISLVFDY